MLLPGKKRLCEESSLLLIFVIGSRLNNMVADTKYIIERSI